MNIFWHFDFNCCLIVDWDTFSGGCCNQTFSIIMFIFVLSIDWLCRFSVCWKRSFYHTELKLEWMRKKCRCSFFAFFSNSLSFSFSFLLPCYKCISRWNAYCNGTHIEASLLFWFGSIILVICDEFKKNLR